MVLEGAYMAGAEESDSSKRRVKYAHRASAVEWIAFLAGLLYFAAVMTAYELAMREVGGLYTGWFISMGCIAACGCFRISLVVKSMLLSLDGAGCTERLRTSINCIRAVYILQYCALFLLSFNFFQSTRMVYQLKTHLFNGTDNCAGRDMPYDEYHKCICGGVNEDYLHHECNLTADVAIGRDAVSTSSVRGFAPFVCHVQREWEPYRNALDACRASADYKIHVFLSRSSIYVTWGFIALWTLIEYDSISVAHDKHLGRARDCASIIAQSIARFCTALLALFTAMYTCVLLTASDWYLDREEYVSVLGNGSLTTMLVSVGAMAPVALSFDSIRRKARELRQRHRPIGDHFDCFLTHGSSAALFRLIALLVRGLSQHQSLCLQIGARTSLDATTIRGLPR